MKSNLNQSHKKTYSSPQLTTYGDVRYLTQATNPTGMEFDFNSGNSMGTYNKSINI